MVNFGINLQLESYPIDLALSVARHVEDLGLYAIFVNDHYMKYSDCYSPEAYLTLAAIGAQTKRLRIGTSVTPIPFRSAPILAKMVSTLDNISKGRLILGVGAGRIITEFEAYGSEFLPPKERVNKTIEGIKLMKRMWTENKVTYEGIYNRVKDVVLLPKPIQKPHPPILIGSKSRRMCRMAVRLGNGWISAFISPLEYKQHRERIIQYLEKIGRKRDDFMFVVNNYIIVTKDREKVMRSFPITNGERYRSFTVGSPEECVEQLQRFVDVGVDLILLRLYNVDQPLDQITMIRDQIILQLDI